MRQDRLCFARGACLYLLTGILAVTICAPRSAADLTNLDIGSDAIVGGLWIDAQGAPFAIAMNFEVAQTETPTNTATPSPLATDTPAVIATDTPSAPPTDTPVLADTPTETATIAPTLPPGATLTPTATETPFGTPTATSTAPGTPTTTSTGVPISTGTPTETPADTFIPTPTIGGLVTFSGRAVLDRDLYVPQRQCLAFAKGSSLAFIIPQATELFYYVAAADAQGNVTQFVPVRGSPPGEVGQDTARAQIILDGGMRTEGDTTPVRFYPVTATPAPPPTPTPTPTCALPLEAIVGDATFVPDLGIDEFNLVLRGVDLDGDTDIDLVAGSESGNLYEATSEAGDIDLTAFSELTLGDGRSFSEFLTGDSAPAFADPDQDEDPDLFLADSSGGIFFSLNLNEGGPGDPFFAAPETVFSTTGVPVQLKPPVVPEVVDINEDGILDIVAGDGNQHVVVLPGVLVSATTPIEIPDATGEERYLAFDESIVWRDYSLAVPWDGAPALYSLDRIEDPSLVGPGILIGFADGRMILLEYASPPEEGQPFPTFDTWILKALVGECRVINAIGGLDASPVFVDHDGDGEGELISANSEGMLFVYENITIELLRGYRSPAKGTISAKPAVAELPVPIPPNASESWGGIVFRPRSNDRDSILRGASIEKANVGVTMFNASAPIEQSQFLSCGEAGIRLKDNAFPTIRDCLISRTHLVGIECLDFSSPTILGTEIRESGQQAVRASDYSVPLITDWNRIVSNYEGILIEHLAGPRLGDVPDEEFIGGVTVTVNLRPDDDGYNIFLNNRMYDIRNLTPGRIYAENAFWGTADPVEIDNRIFDDDESSLLGEVDFRPVGFLTPTYPVVLPTPTREPTISPELFTPTPTPVPTYVVGGPDITVINQPTTWSGVIRLLGDIRVVNGVALDIMPGSIIQVAAPVPTPIRIQIDHSTLRVLGTEDEPVIFMSDVDNGWVGLEFIGWPPVESTLQHCEIRRSTDGLFVRNCSPHFEKVLVTGAGVGCVVEQNGVDTRPVFRRCTFWRCGTGVWIRGDAHPDLGCVAASEGVFDPGGNVFFGSASLDIDVELPILFGPASILAQGNYYVQIVDATGPEGPIRRSERVTFPGRVTDISQLTPFLSRVEEVYVPELPGYDTRPVVVRPFGQVSSEGTIEDEQVWVGRVEVTDDLFILDTLTLLPGTEIVVSTQTGRPLEIDVFAATLYRSDGTVDEAVGMIRSLGTPALPVRFHADRPGPRQWEGIRFLGESSVGTSNLLHTSIKDTWVGVDCVVASPILRNCTIAEFNDIGVNVTNVISSGDQALLELAASQTRHADQIIDSEINNPFGVARPMIRGCAILGDSRGITGEFGVYSQTSTARIEGTAIQFTRFAGIMVRGTRVPDLENAANDLSFNFRANLQNNSMLQIQASGNYWGVPGDFVGGGQFPAYYVDETIIDDDENGNVGRVHFIPALNRPPSRLLEFGDLNGDSTVDGEDLMGFLSTWGSIIGQPRYRIRADFDRNRAVEKEDAFFFSTQWRGPEE